MNYNVTLDKNQLNTKEVKHEEQRTSCTQKTKGKQQV